MATNEQVKSFIKLLGGLAVAECNRRISLGEGFVLPSVVIAQSALETGYGTAGLMTRANAFFGIKAGGSWTGKVYTANTWEVQDGEAYNTTANFRAYDSLEDSVRDYFDLITGASRYSKAISYGLDKSKWLTARETITAIWSGGYATDNLYVQKNMNIIESRDLTSWDNMIDGVSNVFGVIRFEASDFVQGALIVTDSGRSIGLDPTDTTKISIPWDKKFTITKKDTYRVFMGGFNGTYKLHLAKLVGDTATISNGSPIDQYTGYIDMVDMTPGDYSFMLSKSSGEAITPAEIQDAYVGVDWETFPGSNEVVKSVLAYFVKVE